MGDGAIKYRADIPVNHDRARPRPGGLWRGTWVGARPRGATAVWVAANF